jgi:hypothetical protein
MAFGWPVSEKGPAPGRPICPVARCRWISAALLCVPCADWLSPWQYSDRAARGAAEPACGADDVGLGEGADFGRRRPAGSGDDLFERGEALGMRGDVVAIDQPLAEQDVQQAVVERDVGARLERQVEIGDGGGFAAPRVDDDDAQPGLAARASSMRRKTIGWATAGLAPAISRQSASGDVLVAARRRVGAERLLVAGHRRRHAQTRVGIDVVGADQTPWRAC